MEDVTALPDHVLRFLTTMGGHWTEPVVLPGKPRRLLWGDHDYSSLCKRIEVRDNELLAWCASPFPEELRKKIDYLDLDDHMNLPLSGEFEDGTTFAAIYASVRSAGPTMIVAKGGQWSVGADRGRSTFWVGKVTGFGPHLYGNLKPRPSAYHPHPMGFRLQGFYQYHLLHQRSDASKDRADFLWVIDTNSRGAPDRDVVRSELLTLQFAFGTRLFLKALHGFDYDGLPLREHIGGPWGEEAGESGIRTPVPTSELNLSWTVALFEYVSRAHNANRSHRFDLALHHYLNALDGTIEQKYLALSIGLESFAYWLTKDIERYPWRDRDAWRAWVTANKDAIRSLAKPGDEDRVISLLNDAGKHTSTRSVPDALRRFGLNIKPIRDALEGRNTIVHTSEMAGLMLGEPIDWRGALRSVDIVRTTLVALVARASGYDGPIIGWEAPVGGREPMPPDGWWTVGSDARSTAERVFGSKVEAE